MAATINKNKKKCKGLKKSLYNPQIKGCGRNLTINARNFKVVFRAKDGFGNFCNRCKDEWQPAIDEFKANRSKKDTATLKSHTENNTKARKVKKTEKYKSKAIRHTPKSLPESYPDTPSETKETESAVWVTYPRADIDDRVIIDNFDSTMYRTHLPNLNKLSRHDDNITIFLHSILIQSGDDNWAEKESIQEDLCKRFRSKEGATLKGFTMRLNRDGLVELKKQKVGHDKKRNADIMITSHYRLSVFGIEWYNECVKDGLPAPIVPDELKVLKRVYKVASNGLKEESNNEMNTAFVNAENEVIGKDAMIQFLKDYRDKHKMTNGQLSKKLGGGNHIVGRAICQNELPKKFYDIIKNLMLLNPNVNLAKFGAIPDEGNAEKNTEPNESEFFVTPEQEEKQKVVPIQEQLEQKIELADSIIHCSGGYSKVLTKQIIKAQMELSKANKLIFKATLERDMIQGKIDFLTDKYNNL